jgi:hypothetical protein
MKIDIAKAFDSVSWELFIQLLTFIDFPGQWTEWIAILLSTGTTRIMVNGRPGRKICHARGLRKGDPLSHMLFVVVMEVLNNMIADADCQNMLRSLPSAMIRHRASLYADISCYFSHHCKPT